MRNGDRICGKLQKKVVEGFNDVLLPNQTPWRPEEMLERRLVVLRGILKREEVYLRELDALLMVRLPNMSTASLHRSVKIRGFYVHKRGCGQGFCTFTSSFQPNTGRSL